MSAARAVAAACAALLAASCGGLTESDPPGPDFVRLEPPDSGPCERDGEAVQWSVDSGGACTWPDTDNPGNEHFGLGRLNHRLVHGGGATDLWFVGTLAGCASDPLGWYFTPGDDAHRLCPGACALLLDDRGARLERVVGCAMRSR